MDARRLAIAGPLTAGKVRLERASTNLQLLETHAQDADDACSLKYSAAKVCETDDLVEMHYGSRWMDWVVATQARRSRGAQSVHFAADNDPKTIGEEVLVDVLIALHAREFVGNRWSNVASCVQFLRDWPAGAMRLYGASDATCDYNAFLYANA